MLVAESLTSNQASSAVERIGKSGTGRSSARCKRFRLRGICVRIADLRRRDEVLYGIEEFSASQSAGSFYKMRAFGTSKRLNSWNYISSVRHLAIPLHPEHHIHIIQQLGNVCPSNLRLRCNRLPGGLCRSLPAIQGHRCPCPCPRS